MSWFSSFFPSVHIYKYRKTDRNVLKSTGPRREHSAFWKEVLKSCRYQSQCQQSPTRYRQLQLPGDGVPVQPAWLLPGSPPQRKPGVLTSPTARQQGFISLHFHPRHEYRPLLQPLPFSQAAFLTALPLPSQRDYGHYWHWKDYVPSSPPAELSPPSLLVSVG